MSNIVYALLTSEKRNLSDAENAGTNKKSLWGKFLGAITALIAAKVVAFHGITVWATVTPKEIAGISSKSITDPVKLFRPEIALLFFSHHHYLSIQRSLVFFYRSSRLRSMLCQDIRNFFLINDV